MKLKLFGLSLLLLTFALLGCMIYGVATTAIYGVATTATFLPWSDALANVALEAAQWGVALLVCTLAAGIILTLAYLLARGFAALVRWCDRT